MKITHDFHLHTNLSLCASRDASLEWFINKAEREGLTKIAITDHLFDGSVDHLSKGARDFYAPQNFEHISLLRDKIDKHNASGSNIKILFGAEAEYDYKNRRPAITPEVAESLDVLLVPNSHTHLTMPKDFYEPHEKHIEFMIDAFMDIVTSDVAKYITAVPHPFMAVCCPYDNRINIRKIKDDDFKRCFTAAAEAGIALEINPSYLKMKEFDGYKRNATLADMYNDPAFRMLEIGKACGCKFTVGSDSHAKGDDLDFSYIYLLTSVLELSEDDFHIKTR